MPLNTNYNLVLKNILLIIFVFIFSFLIGQIITSYLLSSSGIELVANAKLSQIIPHNKIYILKIIQTISSIFTFILPSLLISIFLKQDICPLFRIKNKVNISYYILIILFMFSITPLMNLIIEWNSSIVFPDYFKDIELKFREMETNSAETVNLLLTGSGFYNLLVNIFLVALLPAIGEEWLFRGILQKQIHLLFNNIHLAIIISAAIFSAIHFQFFGFIPRMLLGIIFGYLVYYSGTIWTAIFAHFFNNFIAVIITYLISNEHLPKVIDNIGSQRSDWYLLVFGILLAFFIGKKLFKINDKKI